MNKKVEGFVFCQISDEQVRCQSLKKLHVCSPAGKKLMKFQIKSAEFL